VVGSRAASSFEDTVAVKLQGSFLCFNAHDHGLLCDGFHEGLLVIASHLSIPNDTADG
jgi:hypothetical protein